MRSVESVERATVTSRIAATLATLAQDVGIADVRIGLGYTAVMRQFSPYVRKVCLRAPYSRTYHRGKNNDERE